MAEAQAHTPSSEFGEWCAWRWLEAQEENDRRKRLRAGRSGALPERVAQHPEEMKAVMMEIAARQAARHGEH